MEKTRLAIVRIRGDVGISADVRKTLKLLRLYKKNYCVIFPSTQSILGMLQKIKDFVTFGELDKETFNKLLKARGRLAGNKPLTEDYLKAKTNSDFQKFSDDFFMFKTELKSIPGLKPFFRLHPPVGGFERLGIKKSFAEGGALGYRGKDINKLLQRMI
ncbi:MAG: 50S ribosomal protein L30 [Candidatus Nanoarchaeia archaeon]